MEKPEKPAKAVREWLAALGRKGGRARMAELTPQQRRRLARKAARTRWKHRRAT